jgi:hypothetical protein
MQQIKQSLLMLHKRILKADEINPKGILKPVLVAYRKTRKRASKSKEVKEKNRKRK